MSTKDVEAVEKSGPEGEARPRRGGRFSGLPIPGGRIFTNRLALRQRFGSGD
ncbi:hypothetical protein [Exilibacterium tricleocarpae]|uniref:hypothetical protein n=1 Tax=Exilibacterium tricleocarpae TaxID=2591008 RepID=UPI0015D39823|nr:hypothetical protein [Exilibacterium tricleocarpae]